MVSRGWRDKYSIRLLDPVLNGHELEKLAEAIEGKWIAGGGPHVDRLEAAFSNRFEAPCLTLSSGTAAIHLALILLGVKKGDEVALSTQTFAASCNPIFYLGARPVFLDSDPHSWTLDPGLLEDWLTERARDNRLPRAIIVVHLFGQCADMDAIAAICGRYEIPIIEDAAHALGGSFQGRAAGTMGAFGAFSLNGNKIISSGGGGILVGHDEAQLERASILANQGKVDEGDGLGDYLHFEVGFNYRLSNLSAAFGLAQLESLPERLEQKRLIAERYRKAIQSLPGVTFMPVDSRGQHTYWLSCIDVDAHTYGHSAAAVIHELARRGIEGKPVWKPLHRQPAYAGQETVGGEVAEALNKTAICLPSSPSLSRDEQEQVIGVLVDLAAEGSRSNP